MFTNNFYNAFKKATFGINTPICLSHGRNEITISEGEPAYTKLHLLHNLDRYGGNDLYNYGGSTYGVLFGDGTSAPTKEDYYLSGQVVHENLGVTSVLSTEITDTYLKRTAVYSIVNNNDKEITIGEIGWFAAKSGQTNQENWIMMDRTLVEPTLVIPPGDVGQITYSLTSNFPTFDEA